MTRGPGTVAVIVTDEGQRFIVEQRTRTRNRAGARKSVAKLYEYTDGRREMIQALDSSLRDTDVAIESAKEAIGTLTDSDELSVMPQ